MLGNTDASNPDLRVAAGTAGDDIARQIFSNKNGACSMHALGDGDPVVLARGSLERIHS